MITDNKGNKEKLDRLDLLLYFPIEEETNRDAEYYDSIDTSDVVVDRKALIKIQRTINRYKRAPLRRAVKKVMSSVAVCLLALLSAGFITIMSVTALREAVWDILVEWYGEYISVRFTNGEDTTLPSNESRLPDDTADTSANGVTTPVAIPPKYIETAYKPMNLPENVEEEIVIQNKNLLYIDYYIGDSWCATYKQGVLSDSGKLIDNTDMEIDRIYINGNLATAFRSEAKDNYTVIWNDGEYFFWIVSYIEYDVALILAKNVEFWEK